MKLRILLTTLALLSTVTRPATAYFSTYTTFSNNSLATADWTPPTTTVRYGSRVIAETITNGTFADGGTGWSQAGSVVVAGKVAVIGQNEHSMLTQNTLSQTFANTSKNLTFEYRIFTTETLPGFDDPCFEVKLGDTVILQIHSSEVDGSTDWQRFSIELDEFPQDQLLLSFSAGNTGDDERQSWAEVRNVTTNTIVGNNTQHITLHTEDGSTFMQNCDNTTIQALASITLPDHEYCTAAFWSVDSDGNKEVSNTLGIDIDSTRTPYIQTLLVSHEPTGEYVLTLPNANTLYSSYHIFDGENPVEYIRKNHQFFITTTDVSHDPKFHIEALDTHANRYDFLGEYAADST